jgi:excisionase family DNA binding protein
VSAALLLLRLADPVGWIALTPDALRDAQAAARDTLGVGAATQDNPQPVGSTSLLTAEDAARLLSVDPSWLLRQAREGRIGHVRIGKYIRFDPQEIVGQCTRQAVTRGPLIRTPRATP